MDDATAPRAVLLTASAVGTVLLVAVIALLPVPYASLSPGPVRDALGELQGDPVLDIGGGTTYPTSGSLHVTTVAVGGGPGSPMALGEFLLAWRDQDTSLLRYGDVYPQEQTAEQAQEEGAAEMTGSQLAAQVAALRELGVAVPVELGVVDVEQRGEGRELRPGDVLTAVAGSPVGGVEDVRERLAGVGVGEGVPVAVLRDGRPAALEVRTLAGEDGSPRLGVTLQADFDVPLDIDFTLGEVVGPSAGLVFALGIVDALTPGAMTGGESIAGTGSIDVDGRVGVIGGLRQKLIGAREAGAEYFLAPAAECAEVRGVVPAGLRLVPVTTLHEARLAVEAIGEGREEDLAGCPS